MSATVFVSYSRTDTDVVSTLEEDLEAFDHRVWHDHELTGGQLWWDQILSRIRECDVFLLAVSPASIASAACMSELGYAQALRKPVLPVLVRDGISESLLPEEIGRIHRVRYVDQDKAALGRLVRAVRDLPPSPPVPSPPPAAPSIPASYLYDLLQEVGSPADLDSTTQQQLLVQLRHQAEETSDADAVRAIIAKFRARDDLLVRTVAGLDEIELSLGGRAEPTTRFEQLARPVDPPSEVHAAPHQVDPAPAPVAEPADSSTPNGDVNGAWWIAPILFGLLGGVVAWFAVRSVNAGTARTMLIVGAVMSVVWLALLG